MFAFPQIISLPVAGITVGGFDWPSLGVLFAWGLVAALVGSSLALLRNYASSAPASGSMELPGKVARIETRRLAVHHGHREAA